MEARHGAFVPRLLTYWKALCPEQRWEGLGEGEWPKRELETGGDIYFYKMNSAGRNGLGLLVLTLAWWGQTIWNGGVVDGIGGGESALARNAEWNFMPAIEAFVAEQEADEAADMVLGKSKNGARKGKRSGMNGRKRKQAEDADDKRGGKAAKRRREASPVSGSGRPKPRPLTRGRTKEDGGPIPADTAVTNNNAGNDGTAASDGDKLKAGASDAMIINDTGPHKEVRAGADSAHEYSNTPLASHPSTFSLTPSTPSPAATTSEHVERTEDDPFAGLTPEEIAKMELDPEAAL
ncbi:hypothetical protein C8R45DRAFT_1101213 [Mycena sanguinolenta]|nr:hypothetical protein C8R45DRAFT_1101213 [Mycena sanguinolenta]